MDRKVFFATRLGTEPIKYPLVCNNTGNGEIAGGSVSFVYNDDDPVFSSFLGREKRFSRDSVACERLPY